jgi:short-subunit dehydrogenase
MRPVGKIRVRPVQLELHSLSRQDSGSPTVALSEHPRPNRILTVLGPFPTLTATLGRASSRLAFLDASLSGPAKDVKATSEDIRCGRISRPMPDDSVGDSGSSIDNRHLLLVGAGPGLGMAVARRFAGGGYRVTLVARSTDGLDHLADGLGDSGAQIDTIAADASDPEGLGARMAELYNEQGAPGLIIYNAVMGAPDKLLSSSVEHLQTAYAVDVISAIVVTQVAAPAMRAAGSGIIIVTGGGFADHPIPALATISLGKAALRSAATMLGADLEPDGIRVATLTIAGQIVAGTAFDPENIAKRYWEVVHSDGPWQAEFRFTGE